MVAMYLIVVAFFVAILAIGYFAVMEGEELRVAPPEGAAAAREAAPRDPTCTTCDGVRPPARATTSDQVVFEVEHRIDAELRDIAHALHAHPESLARLFHA